ncbi:MAG TPA: PAS domain S-box protein [Candidatus Methylacidiphilales bacterium]|nr:PAS domain S-box protein [Candidatus Methylacidiphilales bacterium]
MLADSSSMPHRQTNPSLGGRDELLELLFAHVADAMLVLDAESGIVEVNPAACKTFGYDRSELIGLDLAALVQGVPAEEISGRLRSIECETPVMWKFRTKFGEVRAVDVRLTRMPCPPVGGDEGLSLIVACCRVITSTELGLQQQVADLKLSNERLIDNEQRLRAVIDNAPGLLWTGQPDGYIDFLNRAWVDFTGLKPDEASGWGWMVTIHPDDIDGLVGYWRSILAAGTVGEIEARMRRHDGEFRWFLFRANPQYNADGVLVKWIGTTTDIESRKASENLALCQLKAMEHTLASVARESDPSKVLGHLMGMVSENLRAHSVSVWERKSGDELQLAATYQNGRMILAAHDTTKPPRISLMTMDHPVWREMCRTGKDYVWGEVEGGTIRFRLASRDELKWYPWQGIRPYDASVEDMYNQLLAAGVLATLTLPLLVAGRVAGVLTLRLTHRRQPRRETVAQIQALAHQVMLALQLMRVQPIDDVQI